jgi:Ca2+-binding RTX toxin-like protein
MASVFGTNSSETINAADGVTNGADVIFGLLGDDTIYGLGGNDTIKGGGGADTIYGGSGTDTAEYTDSSTGVTVSLLTGLGYGGTAEGDTLSSIENLTGSVHGDTLVGNDGINVLNGGSGDDILKGGGGADTLNGGNDNDILKGGGGADTLNGGSGNDTASYTESSTGVFVDLGSGTTANGDAQGDVLNSIENLTGSAHNDNLWGNNGANVLRGMDGNDTLKGFGGADTLWGGEGNDSLYGGDGADTLRGENGNDMLNGGAGNDTMIGGNGDDTYYVDSDSDIVTELAGQGTDTVFSSANAHFMTANVENLSLDTDSDTGVYGIGNAQANAIFGNVNDNILDGGGSADQLNGMGGNDTFIFRAGEANGDTVYEYDGNGAGVGDVLYFQGYGTVAEGATFHQLNATDWEITSADGTITDIIHIANGAVVDASDFTFY